MILIFIPFIIQLHLPNIIPDSWRPVETGALVEYDLEEHPLQIRTDSVAGDNTLVDLTVYTSSATDKGEYFAYIYVKFSDVLTYRIQPCVTDLTSFPTTPPSEQDKTWTITKSSTSIKIECNGMEVAKVVYSDYPEDCATAWSNDVSKIMFYPDGYDSDTASDEYRQLPEGLTDYQLVSFFI